MARKRKKRTASEIGRSNVQTSKAHERRVAHLLADWSGEQFRRRRIEGRGRDTVGVDLTGDVIAVEKLARFNIEAKKEEGFSFNALLANITNNKFTGWWHQSTYDASIVSEVVGKEMLPMLFFKPHPNHDFVAIDVAALVFLKPKGNVLPADECAAKAAMIDSGKVRPHDAVRYRFKRPWFPHLLFDEYRYCGPIEDNVSHTKNKKNKKMVSLELPACYICRWRDFAERVDPTSFFHWDEPCVVGAPEDQSGR